MPTDQPGAETASGIRTPSQLPSPSCSTQQPSRRGGASAAYDSTRKVTVLFGGYGATSTTLSETWLFDGGCWQQPHPAISPPPRIKAGMAYDPLADRTVLIGGRSLVSGPKDYPRDGWIWDGSSWTLLAQAPQLDFPLAAFDKAHGVVVVFGWGQAGVPETWTWDSTNWLRQSSPQSPLVDAQSAMCFDQPTMKLLLFGGVGAGGVSGETWRWDGNAWTQLHPMHSPGPRFNHTLICGDQTILSGGAIDQRGSFATGTWRWDGSDWSELVSTRAPGDCCGAGVYDGSRYMMLETGRDGIPIWIWTGSDWSVAT